MPGGSRLEQQGGRGNAAQILCQGQTAGVQSVGDPEPMVGAVRCFEKTVGQACRMGQQMAHGDQRLASVRELGPKVGEPAGQRIIQAEPALVDQGQGRHADDGLGHRGQATDFFLLHGPALFPVGKTGRALVDDFPVFGGDDRCPDNPAAVHRVEDNRVHRPGPVPRRSGCRRQGRGKGPGEGGTEAAHGGADE